MNHPNRIGRVWLIGGTAESVVLATALSQAAIPCTVSVTTETAPVLYAGLPDLDIWVGRLDATTLPTFLQEQSITAILDASHPFAVEVSQLAINIARTYQIPYLRYERPALSAIAQAVDQIVFDHFETLLTSELLTGERVLLTIGYRFLPLFQPWQATATLFARILPSVVALETALAAGFTPDRLIALRPPLTAALETALWQQWQISMVVTKASGQAGGEAVKRQVAAALGIKLITIARPAMVYPQQTGDVITAVKFCHQTIISAT